jgi:hypothetical protein
MKAASPCQLRIGDVDAFRQDRPPDFILDGHAEFEAQQCGTIDKWHSPSPGWATGPGRFPTRRPC